MHDANAPFAAHTHRSNHRSDTATSAATLLLLLLLPLPLPLPLRAGVGLITRRLLTKSVDAETRSSDGGYQKRTIAGQFV
jgi:hypothetical protein